MRIRAVVSATLASAGILLAGWQSGAHVAESASAVGTTAGTAGTGTTGTGSAKSGLGSSAGGSSSGSAASGDTSSGTGTSGSGASGSSGSSSGSSSAGGTFTGDSVQTRFGSVQVQISVSGGKITDVKALQLTDEDRRSVQISNRAAPLLRSEVLQAQSANVQTISGATVTSSAYLTSLQAALDAAHL
ncbi:MULTISPECIES: FMN-binding protein [unclassified Arthrobacter]|uniref:FMN-binding protein n=1 Tax=unclassified Arthrobacter TaxID=235627 RepID=UPI0025B59EC4|nr:FMN-binding protein [Arthrobacter sp. YD4]MDN3936329.1 FMN-binding protein [Arthrobacter sp. YD4]